ncbi:hypothetical protein ACFL6C_07640 [Myxococcota bacterium]
MRRASHGILGVGILFGLGVSCGGEIGGTGPDSESGDVRVETPASAEQIANAQALVEAFAGSGSTSPLTAAALIVQVDNVLRLADVPVTDPTESPQVAGRQTLDCIVSIAPHAVELDQCQFGPVSIDGFVAWEDPTFSMELTVIREGHDGTYSTHIIAEITATPDIIDGFVCFDRVTPRVSIWAGLEMDAIAFADDHCPASGSLEASVTASAANLDISRGLVISFGPTCREAVIEIGDADVADIECPSVAMPPNDPADPPGNDQPTNDPDNGEDPV